MHVRKDLLGAVLVVGVLLAPARSAAEPLVPGPGQTGHDATLAGKAEAYYRQIQSFLAVPLGWGLEAYIADAGNRKLVEDFFAAKGSDFVASSGKHPYEVIDAYGEFGDLGTARPRLADADFAGVHRRACQTASRSMRA